MKRNSFERENHDPEFYAELDNLTRNIGKRWRSVKRLETLDMPTELSSEIEKTIIEDWQSLLLAGLILGCAFDLDSGRWYDDDFPSGLAVAGQSAIYAQLDLARLPTD